MMDLAMNFDADECLVTAMFDKGNRNDTMEAIDHIIPFLKGDADMIGLEIGRASCRERVSSPV